MKHAERLRRHLRMPGGGLAPRRSELALTVGEPAPKVSEQAPKIRKLAVFPRPRQEAALPGCRAAAPLPQPTAPSSNAASSLNPVWTDARPPPPDGIAFRSFSPLKSPPPILALFYSASHHAGWQVPHALPGAEGGPPALRLGSHCLTRSGQLPERPAAPGRSGSGPNLVITLDSNRYSLASCLSLLRPSQLSHGCAGISEFDLLTLLIQNVEQGSKERLCYMKFRVFQFLEPYTTLWGTTHCF